MMTAAEGTRLHSSDPVSLFIELVRTCRGQGRASWVAEACNTAPALGVLAKAGHGRARLRVPREVKGYSANVLASSLGLDPRHYRLRPDARQRHEGAPVVERIRLGGRRVLEQSA